ncbi:MAG TPA: rhamnulokinase family protein [Microbacteriaceae bacterium]
MVTGAVAAIDLGATSGRVMIGRVAPNELSIRQIARFPNTPVPTVDGLHWNIRGLYAAALDGLASAVREEPGLASIGVDSWACDYGLLRDGQLLAQPYHYRDERTTRVIEEVHSRIDLAELYVANGLQYLPFNTLYQLSADRAAGTLARADDFLLIPDLIAFWLTGNRYGERTNASTTGLLGITSRVWDSVLIERLDLPRAIFPELVDAGSSAGTLSPVVAEEIGAGERVAVTAVGSHDTASAVAAVPAASDDFAYISCGTWSLVGLELDHPHVSEAGRLAGFTNEGGVDGRIRYLHNVMGLWLLNESVRTWESGGEQVNVAALLRQAEAATATIFDPEDPRFLPPGDIPARIAELCQEHGLRVPRSRPDVVRSIVESLAHAYARTLNKAAQLTGKTVSVVHLVGGGSQNDMLCQLTADRTGLTVLAGPAEATSIGNILVQARAQGFATGSLESLRALVAIAFPPRVYLPRDVPPGGAIGSR